MPFQNFADYRDGKIYYTCYNPEERNHGYLYSVSLKNGSVTELAGNVDYAYRWYGLFYLNHVQYEEDDLQYLSIFDERTGETNLVSDQILDYVDDQNYIYYAKVVDGSHPATVEMWRYETATGEQKQLTDAFLCYGLESLNTKHIVYFTDDEYETTASKKW